MRPGDERPSIHRETLEWQPLPTAPPLRLDVKALFAALADPE